MKLSLTNTGLKWIAIVAMIIDHIGAVLYPDVIFLRIIGRIAFPIFAFLIVEGYHHTKNVDKYGMRLLLFAILSEVPFDLAFSNSFYALQHQNVFFTLTLGLYAISLYDRVLTKDTFTRRLLATTVVFFIGVIALIFNTDYSIFGVLLIVLIHVYNKKPLVALWIVLINVLMVTSFTSSIQLFALLSIPFIFLYNGEKGKSMKYVFYIIYPVHIFLLYLIGKI